MATVDGTRRFLARAVQRGAVSPGNVRLMPLKASSSSGLSCAALGYGAYRVGGGQGAAAHMRSVRAAISAGVNLLDTSSHYSASKDGAHGASEKLIGQAISEAVAEGDATRDELIVCTKVGHVARGVERPPESVPVSMDGGQDDWHSIHPDFIHAEAKACSERLCTAPDFVLLHNPEYALSSQMREGVEIGAAWDEMYRRLTDAFKALEQLCDEGTISTGYGVSGNFLSCIFSTTGRPNGYEALTIDRVLEAAETAASSMGKTTHRLKLLQVPVNAVESGAILGRGKAMPQASEGDIAVAERNGIAVVTNRPLNTLPLPGVSSGDWGRGGASHVVLKESKPLGTQQALLKKVLLESSNTEGQTMQLSEVSQSPVALQRLALRLAVSAPGVSCVLSGMRKETYVDDAAAVLREAPLPAEQAVRAMRSVRTLYEELGAEHRRFWA